MCNKPLIYIEIILYQSTYKFQFIYNIMTRPMFKVTNNIFAFSKKFSDDFCLTSI